MHPIKQRLERLRQELLADDAHAREAARPVKLDQSAVGRLSRMDAIRSQAMAQESQRRKLQQLRLVDAALARIERGEYGLCTACEEEIDPRRLEADPTAALCIACAAKRER
jgi:DnaK suppressor protein